MGEGAQEDGLGAVVSEKGHVIILYDSTLILDLVELLLFVIPACLLAKGHS